ncbi:putative transposable element [Trichonephila clavipes]|nr:putative transposable element [Trichonephila clavipes]
MTGHECLRSHLYRIGIGDIPDCTLWDSGQPMTTEHLDMCLALINLNSIVKKKLENTWRGHQGERKEGKKEESEHDGERQQLGRNIEGREQDGGVIGHGRMRRENVRMSDIVITLNNLVALHFKYDQARRRFVEWAQNEIAVGPDFHKQILFSDEAHFWLNGYVNKQNCRIWSEANPQVYVETPLHPEKLTVWCALWAGGIIGSYLKNDEGHNVTVNGDRYRAMITNFFIPELNNHDVQELWFQQDGATCHTARATIDLLKSIY